MDDAPHNATFFRRFVWPSWTQRKAMLRREAWIVTIAAYPILLFASLWPPHWRNDSPTLVLADWAVFMIRMLQFHFGLLLLIVVTLGIWRRRLRLALVALPPTLFTVGFEALQYIPHAKESTAPPAFRVMTANLLMVNTDTAGIIGEIEAAQPDVLLLQEYTAHWHAAIQKSIGARYPYNCVVMRDDSFGIAIYSRTPFASDVDPRFPIGRAGVEQMRGEINIGGGRRIALYNVHLLPPRTLVYWGEHRLQIADLVETLKNEKLPYVVCGDFNFPDVAPQHAALKNAGAREAHELAGYGRGATWPVNSVFRYILPGIRIDHVYLGPTLTATRCQTGTGRGSDHRPVVVDVAFRR